MATAFVFPAKNAFWVSANDWASHKMEAGGETSACIKGEYTNRDNTNAATVPEPRRRLRAVLPQAITSRLHKVDWVFESNIDDGLPPHWLRLKSTSIDCLRKLLRMGKRVTLRDIAKHSAYHVSTVSRALAGDLSIPAATRRKIKAIADEMGYSPDPMLQALASYRQTLKPPSDHAPLAWLSCDSRSEFRPDYLFSKYLAGALKRAQQFGYRLEEFLLGAKDMTPTRMQKILLSRGISGVLVSPQPHGWRNGMIEMDWSAFAAVTFGYSLTHPSLHLATSHHGNAARLAVRKLAALGHKRIGLYVSKIDNERVAGGWLGGYAGEVLGNPQLAWIEPFLYDDMNAESFATWQHSNRLDAAVTWSSVIDMVQAPGPHRMNIPVELSMVSLRVQPNDDYHTGINQNDEEIGVTAVDTLLGLLHANERGVPKICRCILIEGTWREGRTVRNRLAT